MGKHNGSISFNKATETLDEVENPEFCDLQHSVMVFFAMQEVSKTVSPDENKKCREMALELVPRMYEELPIKLQTREAFADWNNKGGK
tara:strand:- start:303 stop:566 length:264 start_codon:yes stop_codon:yes gene_type:complete